MPIAAHASTIGSEPHGGGMMTFSAKPGSPRPPRIVRAEGVYLWDNTGRRLVDACSGPVAVNLGHGNKRILAAMQAQADKITYTHYSQFESEANLELADLLTGLAGQGFERAWFCSGGSEAVEATLKFARQHAVLTGQSKRWKVISRATSYHGNTLGALSVTGDASAHAMYGPMMQTMPKVPTPFSYRVPANFTAESYARHCATELERTIEREGPESVLAFIVEPVGGVSTGALVVPDDYIRTIRDICTRHGVLLIFDEVITGVGRTGKFLAAHHLPDALPDMVVLAKGLTGGYTPFGAMLAPAAMVATVASGGGFMHGHTYTGNPMSCAIAHAALSEVVDRKLADNAARMGALLKEKLHQLAARSPLVGDVRGKGLLCALEIVADKSTKQMTPLEHNAPSRLQALALEQGLSVYCRRTNGGRDGDWVMVSPPLISEAHHIDEIATGLERTLRALADELTAKGVKLGS
jgi:adenosylmethionine-8-amino-7-oxononanoate aminotransferase